MNTIEALNVAHLRRFIAAVGGDRTAMQLLMLADSWRESDPSTAMDLRFVALGIIGLEREATQARRRARWSRFYSYHARVSVPGLPR